MPVSWERLIRFVATDGRTLRGEPILPSPDFDLGTTTAETKLQAKVIEGDDIYDTTGTGCRVTDQIVTVQTLLGPLAPTDVPILRCVGLNYAKHIREAGRKPPPFPFIFFKPSTSIAGHGEAIVVPRIAQDDQADYEGELCFVLGRDAKDVQIGPDPDHDHDHSHIEDALSYVAAYTAGNDVSARKLQRDPAYAGVVPQWGFSKGFDTFAPLGPALVRADLVGDPAALELATVVNGEVRQRESVGDLLFDVAYLISYLSSGTTLQAGSVVMTGTPGGTYLLFLLFYLLAIFGYCSHESEA